MTKPNPNKRPTHTLSSKDEVGCTATCAICGPVGIHKDGHGSWRCAERRMVIDRRRRKNKTPGPTADMLDWVDDLRIFKLRGLILKEDYARACGMSKVTFSQRLTRARAYGLIKPGTKSSHNFRIEIIDADS